MLAFRRSFTALVPGAFAFALVHCGGGASSSDVADGRDGSAPVQPEKTPDATPGPPPAGLHAPQQHRSAAAACATTRPPGIDADGGAGSNCSHDADCTQGQNGRCLPSRGQIQGNFCTNDGCFVDSDCTGSRVCECGTTIGSTTYRSGNACLVGNCRTDGDCGNGGYCSPSLDPICGQRNGVEGYYCHTTSDDCTNDSDCADGGGGYCAFQPTVGKWMCIYGICAG